MANVLSEEKKQEVLALGRLSWPLRRIEQATGVRRETASAYLKAAGIPVRGPGRWGREGPKPAKDPSPDLGPPPKTASDPSPDSGPPKPAKDTSPDLGSGWSEPGRSPIASACEPHREFVEDSLAKGRNAKAIWQDLVDDHGFEAGYASVKRFVRKLRGRLPREARVVIETPPGQEAQVDFGTGPMVRHPVTGKYQRTRLFVLTLGYSRKSIRLLTFQSSAQIWVRLHEEAFRRLGGVPRVVILDNLAEGVLKPDVYDPALNPLYQAFLKHHGAVAIPCRVGDPDRKGKVESGVGHAKRTPLKGLRFEAMAEGQTYLDRWEERWADTRIHGRTKRQVLAMFAEEQPLLLPLPAEPFRHFEYGQRTVHLDGHVEVARAYYAAPPGWIGQEVQVQWDDEWVRLLDPRTGELLREHLRKEPGRFSTPREDRPKRTPPTTRDLLRRTRLAGENIGRVCHRIHAYEGEVGIRRILGVVSLARRYGAAVVDDACSVALEVGAPSYRFVRRYLERRVAAPLALRQVDPLIRQLTEYRDLVHRLTKEGEKT